jgi:hypothetical protein
MSIRASTEAATGCAFVLVFGAFAANDKHRLRSLDLLSRG